MKYASQLKLLLTNLNPEIIKPKAPLVGIKMNDHSLLAIRDLATEALFNPELLGQIPKFYSVVSQSRKIFTNEKISTKSRLFLNFESFKWSELYFHFLKNICDTTTNNFILRNLLYHLDPLIAHYYLSILGVHKDYSLRLFDRVTKQNQILSSILRHESSNELLLIYIFDLLLVTLDEPNRTNCKEYIKRSEAVAILHQLVGQELVEIRNGKIKILFQNKNFALSVLIKNRGKMLISTKPEKTLCQENLNEFKQLFKSVESKLNSSIFESAFTHI